MGHLSRGCVTGTPLWWGDQEPSASHYLVRREGDYWVVRDSEYRQTRCGWVRHQVVIIAPSFQSAWEGLDRLIWDRALQRAEIALRDRPDLVRELNQLDTADGDGDWSWDGLDYPGPGGN